MAVLLLPPWRRAPLLPFRQPAVILAVLGAAAILACASASAVLFLSSASSESLHRIVAAGCPDATGVTVATEDVGTFPLDPPPPVPLPVRTVDDARVRSALTARGLPEPYRVSVAEQPVAVLSRTGGQSLRMFHRDGVADQITSLTGPAAGRGVWMPAGSATRLGVHQGDQVQLSVTSSIRVPVRVVGIYRDLFDEPVRPFWCSYATLFQTPGYGSDIRPPPLLIPTDEATFAALRAGYGGSSTESWVSPVDTRDLTLSRARTYVAAQHAAYGSAGLVERVDYGSQNSGPGQLPAFTERTALVRDGLRGPVLPIALGGSLLALLLVGAAGSYWADRRAREVRLLSARGVGPGALALKAVLELALPAAVGTVLGWLLARWLVGLLGPSPLLDSAAPGQAGLTALVALVAGLALLALVAGLRSRAATERPVGVRRSWVGLVPWELLLLAAALGCWLRLRGSDAVTLVDGIAQINLLVVAFPLLLIVGGSVLLVRLLVLALPRLAGRAGRLGTALYLAVRRVTAAPVATMVLLAAASTPVAVLVYAAGLTQTSDHTLAAKAQLLTGSDVALISVDPVRRTPVTDAVGTVVVRYQFGKVDGQSDDVAVLAIDPDTFASTAFWDRRLADASLDDLVARLRAPAPDGVVPAIVLPDGPAFPAGFDVGLGTSTVRVADAGTARFFPGRRLRQPMLVVDRARLGAVDPHAGSTYELWSRGDVEQVRAALAEQDARVFFLPKDRASVFDVANFIGVSWTFGYLSALAALVGTVAIGGLLLYLETRQRTRAVSYVLGRRMGLSRRTHLRSLLAELATLLGLAWAGGTVLGWVAVLLVYGQLDIDPVRPPPPLLTVPTGTVLASAAAVGLVAVLTALYAQRSADRADVAQVLRLDS